MQELREQGSEMLVQRTIRFVDLCAGAYRREYLVVSHRWEAPDQPDGLGVQALAVQEHLKQRPEIKFVWFGTRRRGSKRGGNEAGLEEGT